MTTGTTMGSATTTTTGPDTRPAVRTRPVRSRSERAALAALLALTALTYLWNLAASGYANSFYAAAAQAGTKSWKALLFGSVDAGNVITVDKPPAAMWVMGLSGRLFGFSSWSMLAPEALMGVASVALLYAAVRRWAGPGPALAAGAVLAFTPVAVLMFRYNNPDALLVLLMTAAVYTVVRAVDAGERRAGTGWLLLAGALLGFGFLTKMLQVMLVVPALAGVYLVAARGGLGRRIRRLLTGGVSAVVSAGWYVLLVGLWPASDRPYIGGSTDNSLLQLALGYNGLSRIFGQRGGPGAHGAAAGFPGMPPGAAGMPPGAGGHRFSGFGGAPGIERMFNDDFATNISWLLPSALILLVAGLWLTRRTPRTDRTRAALVLFGGWLVVTAVVFSFMSGITHPYYTVAIAPALAGLVAVGAAEVWRHRAHWAARAVLSISVLVAAVWSWELLERTPEFLPWLRWVVLAVGLLGAGALALPARMLGRAGVVAAVIAALVGSVSAPSAYAAQTALTAHQGRVLSAGPNNRSGPGGFGRQFMDSAGGRGGADGAGPAGNGAGGAGPSADQAGTAPQQMGGFGMDQPTNPALTALLRSAGTTWSAATVGANSAASLELASGTSVIALGGFSGGDPAPTLAQFQQWVAAGKVRYFIASPFGHFRGHGGDNGPAAQINAWVTAHYRASSVAGSTVYDLRAPSA